MPQAPDWKRYLEAGMQFTEFRRSQARALAGDLVSTGQLARDQVTAAVDEMVAMSRRRTEQLQGIVRSEVQRQLGRSASRPRPTCAVWSEAERGGEEVGEASGEAGDAAKKATTRAKAPREGVQEGRREEGGLTTLVRRRLDAELVRRGLASSRAGGGRSGRGGTGARRAARPR